MRKVIVDRKKGTVRIYENSFFVLMGVLVVGSAALAVAQYYMFAIFIIAGVVLKLTEVFFSKNVKSLMTIVVYSVVLASSIMLNATWATYYLVGLLALVTLFIVVSLVIGFKAKARAKVKRV